MGKWYRKNNIIYVETTKGQPGQPQRMPYPQQNFQNQPGMGQNRMRKFYYFFLLGNQPLKIKIFSQQHESTTTKWNAWTKPNSRSKWDAPKYG